MTLSPADTSPVLLEEVRSPAPSPYDGVRVEGYVVRGKFEMVPTFTSWWLWWRDIAGVTVVKATAGTVPPLSDRPRWFFVPGADADRLPFAAPNCGLPSAVAGLEASTPIAVVEMAVPEDHACFIRQDPEDPTEMPHGNQRATAIQVRPLVGEESYFRPFYFAIASDGMMPRGHLPTLAASPTYVGDVVGAWLPRDSFVVVCNDPRVRLQKVLRVQPKVPEGTPVIAASEFARSGFRAISWPRGTSIVNGQVQRSSPWPEEYTPGVYPAVAVARNGEQRHVAIWVPTSRSPTPVQLDRGLRRLSQSQELARPPSRSSVPGRPPVGPSAGKNATGPRRHSTTAAPRSRPAPVGRNRQSGGVFAKSTCSRSCTSSWT